MTAVDIISPLRKSLDENGSSSLQMLKLEMV
jgi:hypothetical protein